jgi:DNA-directed RNA polymerase specialized sigma24 family protein
MKGFEGLGPKVAHLSDYLHVLTDKQQMAFSLKNEYGLKPAEVASRMGLDRKTTYEHLKAADKKINEAFSSERRKARLANNPAE